MSAPCPALGFVVRAELDPALSAERRARVQRAWSAFLEARGLVADGALGGAGRAIVVTSDAGQATENDRAAAESWLAGRSECRSWAAEAVRDLRPDR